MCGESLIIQKLVVIIVAKAKRNSHPPRVDLVMGYNRREDKIKMFSTPFLLPSCSCILAK